MRLNHLIDHTVLKPTALIGDVEKCCKEAIQYCFAAVCIPPPFVKMAKSFLKDSSVKVGTVVGFPFGYSAIEAKIAESVLAMVDGADELDVVINLIALKNKDWTYLSSELNHLMPVIKRKNKTLKIIIESGVLTDKEVIECCQLYGVAEIDYLKTSTGYAEKGATLHAIRLFKANLPPHIGIKASGGIRDYAFAKSLVEAGATRLGCSASVAIVADPENH